MMMWKAEFEERAKEVEGYFDLLKALDRPGAIVNGSDTGGGSTPVAVDQLKTLKAAAFLILYNLVESTMRNGIDAIVTELRENQVSFDLARSEIRTVALNNIIRRKNGSALQGAIARAETDLLTCAFNGEDLFDGNVDARLIRETAREYGFSPSVKVRGDDLLSVKTNRNDLSHGNKSFGEVGREHSVDDLIEMKEHVVRYLRDVTSNIDDFISAKDYLAKTSEPTNAG